MPFVTTLTRHLWPHTVCTQRGPTPWFTCPCCGALSWCLPLRSCASSTAGGRRIPSPVLLTQVGHQRRGDPPASQPAPTPPSPRTLTACHPCMFPTATSCNNLPPHACVRRALHRVGQSDGVEKTRYLVHSRAFPHPLPSPPPPPPPFAVDAPFSHPHPAHPACRRWPPTLAWVMAATACTIVSYVGALSLAPHQEARFLLPLGPLVCLLFGGAMWRPACDCTTHPAPDSTAVPARVQGHPCRLALSVAAVAFNLALAAFWSCAHQGGVHQVGPWLTSRWEAPCPDGTGGGSDGDGGSGRCRGHGRGGPGCALFYATYPPSRAVFWVPPGRPPPCIHDVPLGGDEALVAALQAAQSTASCGQGSPGAPGRRPGPRPPAHFVSAVPQAVRPLARHPQAPAGCNGTTSAGTGGSGPQCPAVLIAPECVADQVARSLPGATLLAAFWPHFSGECPSGPGPPGTWRLLAWDVPPSPDPGHDSCIAGPAPTPCNGQ
jgi:hypothetical protein